jgi:hypothetical protein
MRPFGRLRSLRAGSVESRGLAQTPFGKLRAGFRCAKNVRFKDNNQTGGNLLSIGFPNVLSGPLGGRSAAVFSQDRLILLHRQIPLLQQVVHFTGGEVGLL